MLRSNLLSVNELRQLEIQRAYSLYHNCFFFIFFIFSFYLQHCNMPIFKFIGTKFITNLRTLREKD